MVPDAITVVFKCNPDVSGKFINVTGTYTVEYPYFWKNQGYKVSIQSHFIVAKDK